MSSKNRWSHFNVTCSPDSHVTPSPSPEYFRHCRPETDWTRSTDALILNFAMGKTLLYAALITGSGEMSLACTLIQRCVRCRGLCAFSSQPAGLLGRETLTGILTEPWQWQPQINFARIENTYVYATPPH